MTSSDPSIQVGSSDPIDSGAGAVVSVEWTRIVDVTVVVDCVVHFLLHVKCLCLVVIAVRLGADESAPPILGWTRKQRRWLRMLLIMLSEVP